jgi:uncharacterized protein YdhG (YjbR/CyaY superfamily)
VSKAEVDQYLRGLPEAAVFSLQALRRQVLTLVPDGEEGISYAMPCVKVSGKAVAGYAAFKKHIGYFPHSGRIVPQLAKELADRKQTTGGFQFGLGEVLPDDLIAKLVGLRLKELAEKYPDLEFPSLKSF